jgi:tRNA(Ile)-lysidine synthase TilS/MesJ
LAVKKYRLIEAGDRIAVCISGGKDSMLLAKLMQELKRHSEVPFELVFLVMDPGYNPKNRQKIEENAKLLNVPIEVFTSDIFAVADNAKQLGDGSPCYLCARMRRGHLYAKAKELGCNKIALGHHKSDVIETTVMGMLYGGQLQGMLPRLTSTNSEGMELIRPMYCILEEDIIRWQKYNGLQFIACACKFVKGTSQEILHVFSARKRVKELIAELKKEHSNVENCIFQSIHNVQLDTLVEYKQDGVKKLFLD